MTNAAPWWKNTRGEYYVIVQVFLFALIAAGPLLDGRQIGPDALRLPALVVGGVLVAIGGLLSLAGLFGLGRNLSVLPHPKDDAEMIQSGAYGLVRHPIYSGLIIAGAGWGIAFRSGITLGLALALFLFFDVKSRREERWLMRKFPGYAAYRQRVHKLIPFVY
ncbi:methyltransferase family protein [Aggregatilinea lenta]|uniref:methyltransferase family protein n=1 Tax=Aggregatilinea lenta TaxID=913108 RepID=UPI000E5A5BD4|nr:isoprenylcysteine carboxylmethyltransferase family protein [Aggregatilinea lenta]